MSNDEIMRELVEAFRSEVGELFDELAGTIGSLSGQQGEALHESARTVMRLAHNLKGASGSVGLTTLSHVAHSFEDAVSPLCLRREGPPDDLVRLLEAAIVSMQALAERATDIGLEPATEGLIERLERFAAPQTAGSLAPPAMDGSSDLPGAPTNESVAADAPQIVNVNGLTQHGRLLADERAGAARLATSGDGSTTERGAATTGVTEHSPTYVRVATDRLDALAGRLDELIKLRGDLARSTDSMQSAVRVLDSDERSEKFQAIRLALHLQRQTQATLARVIGDLTSDVQRSRTVALSTLAPQWRRVVRESADTLGKRVELKIHVGDTEVDKQVLEHLRDPIVHLLRNAVDHGIESWEERHLLGKPEVGALSIVAQMVGAGIALEIRDDGQGLIPDEIAKAAVACGVISETQASRMSDPEKVELLYRDGFSTAATVNTISGRGVGLAAVRQGVTQVGGHCSIGSPGRGQGSVFRLQVPISVLATTGLLVAIDEVVYMLPITTVERALRAKRGDVRVLDGSPVLVVNGLEPVPVVTLSTQDIHRLVDATQFDVVVLSSDSERVALVVNEVLDQQECFTRRLPWNFKRSTGVHGAVVREDGSIAIALDVDHLLQRATPRSAPAATRAPALSAAPAKLHLPILVVDDSLTNRTLQRNILASAGYTVDVAVDGQEAWEKLSQQDYALLLTDIEMPRMDGLELTRRVRADPKRGALPIVLVTSRGKQGDIQQGAAAGADEYLVKGQFDHERLLQAVERHLYRK